MEDYILQMTNICKAYNKVEVLKEVNFNVKYGEIHALIGENGAGKSTLMNILGGVTQKDSGIIKLMGREVNLLNTLDAKKNGISFIHQELNLVNDLTVYENMFLGSEIVNKFGFIDVEKMCKKSQEILNSMDINIDPKTNVGELDVSFKQIVEIARALLQDSKIIIMDEPTTSLSDHEIENLFKLMKGLKQSGVSIIFISHKLKEVMRICDSYTVLRDGVVTGTGNIQDTDEQQLTRLMVGKSIATLEYYRKREIGDVVLEVKSLNSKYFKNINFKLHKGEILGFTGLSGDGRSELFQSIFGYLKLNTGEILIKNNVCKINHPNKALKSGIALLPKNRKENAIIKDMNVVENITISSLEKFVKGFIIDSKKEIESCKERIEETKIKVMDINMPITNLSGGNQQKVVLSKWIEADADIIILDNPTQGVDIGAKSDMYELIMKLAEKGKGIIVLSSEVPEILKLCDRIYVMYHGEITGILNREEANEENIMLYAAGVKRSEVS
ncbi:sugar ABC transporter ATP-binding protein [Caloramator sp. E03]|uniref:sugar ABC transporter ATP-binding protein n=1 Tax=Caloramator sp. E03 TaxID=2576307 RepID=UPI001FA94AC0|nr:sugar ABC transporter ATP-binding protein [Caloramator sp. E03]